MNQFVNILVLLAFLFVLTYDPKSRTLETFIEGPPSDKRGGCCSRANYRADNPLQCEPPYYQGLQFANTELGCPAKSPHVNMGVIV